MIKGDANMKLTEKSCVEFIELLSSKEPVPGGGGSAALVGAVGTALGSMVCNLTLGKKKYMQYEADVKIILEKNIKLYKTLLAMIDEDAENFLPLSKAYGMKKDTPDQIKLKEETLENALKNACKTPMLILKYCYDSIKLLRELVDKCSLIVISDVGVGVQCLRSALLSAHLNVIVNINSIKDHEFVNNVKSEIQPVVDEGIQIADEVYGKVLEKMR
jgi:formiminotetrahydrofolate cyclodeaminase